MTQIEDVKELLSTYGKKYIKIGTEADFMFQKIFPLYRFLGQYRYPVNIKNWIDGDRYLYIKATESYDFINEFYEFFDEEDKIKYNNYFHLKNNN